MGGGGGAAGTQYWTVGASQEEFTRQKEVHSVFYDDSEMDLKLQYKKVPADDRVLRKPVIDYI